MTIKQMFLKGLDERDLIVFLPNIGEEYSDEEAFDIHSTMSPSDNMVFFNYGHLLKQTILSKLIPDEWVAAFIRAAAQSIGNAVKAFLISKSVRDNIVSELRENINGSRREGGLNPRSITFVAHGIGSIIVCDYLSKYKPDVREVSAVFIGSPIYLNFPWSLISRSILAYKGRINVFSGTSDPICFYGKRKRNIGVELKANNLGYDLFTYVEYISRVNNLLSNLWNREKE